MAGIILTHTFTRNKSVGILKKRGTNLWDSAPDSEDQSASTVISKKDYWQKIVQRAEEENCGNEPTTTKKKNQFIPFSLLGKMRSQLRP